MKFNYQFADPVRKPRIRWFFGFRKIKRITKMERWGSIEFIVKEYDYKWVWRPYRKR